MGVPSIILSCLLAEERAAIRWRRRTLKAYEMSKCTWLHDNECFIGSGAAAVMLAAANTSAVLADILRTAAVCSQKAMKYAKQKHEHFLTRILALCL